MERVYYIYLIKGGMIMSAAYNRNNEFSEKINGFNDLKCYMENVDGIIPDVKPLLGAFDAAKEWNDDPERARQMFLHTKAYKDFLDTSSLILLGRTGTGKTAILRSICNQVQQGEVPVYSLAVMIPFDEILETLLNSSSASLFTDTQSHLEIDKIITMHINCYIMKALIKKYSELASVSSKMFNYIRNHGLNDISEDEYHIKGTNKFRNIVQQVKKDFGDNAGVATACSIYEIGSILVNNEYDEAYVEMRQVLDEKKLTALALVDTSDHYDLRDARIVSTVKRLIAVCFDFYNLVSKNHVYIKLSIPSEVHTHIIEALPGKQHQNTVVIHWTTNDLTKMIALRILRYFNGKAKRLPEFVKKYKYEDFYKESANAADNAKALVYEILPESCPTSLDYNFATISYCIRHTLKKPREMLYIFNTFLQKIIDESDIEYFYKNPLQIRNMIHSTQEDMIMQALSMYTDSYDDIQSVCDTVLRRRCYHFLGGELDNKLKEAAANHHTYGIDDIKRILLESGLVGKVANVSYIYVDNEGKDKHMSKNVPPSPENAIQVIRAKFEYQVKGRINFNKDAEYVIHPMCYEHFECCLGMRTLVYPEQFADDSEIMNAVRLKTNN